MTVSHDFRYPHTLEKRLACFRVGNPHTEGGLHLVPSARIEAFQHESGWLLKMQPSGDYHTEDEWALRLSDTELAKTANVVLEVEFFDEGYGAIEAFRLVDPDFRGEFATPSRRVSHTRLNTATCRRAAFAFDRGPRAGELPMDKPHFKLTGIQNLKAVRLLDSVSEEYWETLAASVPVDVPVAVSLERRMQVVSSSPGALSGTGEFENDSVATLREHLPLIKALGFNAVESYVRWNFVEPELGRFDWSVYDTIVGELQRFGLKWFPLLIVGSGYSLPKWFFESEENIGFVCLEHGMSNPIQSIWSPFHKKHVTRFLQAFGRHYEPMGCLQGVRLGPSGNFGESQFPAGGNWGYRDEPMHIHIGMWAGDPYAREDFRRYLREKYESIQGLNAAWQSEFESFEDVDVRLPVQCKCKRQRMDLNGWYTDSMSEWCEWWAIEARKAMPNSTIYQSSGGWGALEIGTDYSAQAKSMIRIDGGIRLTNELDSFHQCFYATRLAATAARLYNIPLGFEPAMGHTARGVAGRIFNCVANSGDHFFVYSPNVLNRQTSIESWLKHYRFFNERHRPHVEVAVYYPQTMNFLSSDTFRYLNAWGFNPYAREIRDRIEVDYLDDRLIQEGFLDRYKALVFAWGDAIEESTLRGIDRWLRGGGAVIFPCFLSAVLATVEGDDSLFTRWTRGDAGAGAFFRYVGDDEPPGLYADYVRARLLEVPSLSSCTRTALEMEKPDKVFVSAGEDGAFLILNFHDDPAVVSHPCFGSVEIPPYSIERVGPK